MTPAADTTALTKTMVPVGYRATIVADSVSPIGVRLVTILARFPKFILAEVNTHRVLTKSSASSRAIPLLKRILQVREDPFIPHLFGANQRGMSSSTALDETGQDIARGAWLRAMNAALTEAEVMASVDTHKQWASRILEPYLWHEALLTGTEWTNFWRRRVSKLAQPEIAFIAWTMRRAVERSIPKEVPFGGWHLPFIRPEDYEETSHLPREAQHRLLVRVSTARCARLSYMTHEGHRSLDKDLALYDQLLRDGHMSPFEHVATPSRLPGFIGNFRDWKQHRKEIPNEENMPQADGDELDFLEAA